MANLLTGNLANFATGIGTWTDTTAGANFTLSHSATDGGTLSAAVTTGGSNIGIGSHLSGDAVKIPVTEGATLTAGAKTKQLSGTPRGWRVEVNFYNAAGANHANLTAATGTTVIGSYVTLSGIITVPALSVRCRLRVRWDVPAVGETFLLDDAVLDDSSVLNTGNTQTHVRFGGAWVLTREDRIS